jgi:hypothetical protein
LTDYKSEYVDKYMQLKREIRSKDAVEQEELDF